MDTSKKRKLENKSGQEKESGGKSKRLRRKYFVQKRAIEIGTSGFFLSSPRGRENQSTGEIISVFQQVDRLQNCHLKAHYLKNNSCDISKHVETMHAGALTRLQSTSLDKDANDDDQGEEEDIETSIDQELAAIRSQPSRTSNSNLLTPMDVGIECLSFIRLNPAAELDPVTLVEELFEEVVKSAEAKASRKTRYTLRIVPVQTICKADLSNITVEVNNLLKKHGILNPQTAKPTFAVHCKIRNCDKLVTKEVVAKVAQVMIDQGCTVHLDNPAVSIVIEAFKTVAGISIVQSYLKYRKFNLHGVYEKGIWEASIKNCNDTSQ